MEWTTYNTFNFIEAWIWWGIAAFLLIRIPPGTPQQRVGVILAAAGFFVFGVTDVLEIGCNGQVPYWLWGLKIVCGVTIFCSRYIYRGWSTFRPYDREFLFGLFCLFSVAAVMMLQATLEPLNPAQNAPPPAAEQSHIPQ